MGDILLQTTDNVISNKGEEESYDAARSCLVKCKQVEPFDIKKDLCDKFRQILSDRQELRRRNVFLQKKMVEFFKKRKMDHVLKEDPKGLDLEGKYLKRLYDLQEFKQQMDLSEENMKCHKKILLEEQINLADQLNQSETNYFDRQRGVAGSVLLKSKKHISNRAITKFIEAQKVNSSEICQQHYLEIKERKTLEQKQVIVNELENLGRGQSRADYELLLFQYRNVEQMQESKAQEVVAYADKARKVINQRRLAENRLEDTKSAMLQQLQRKQNTEARFLEVRDRAKEVKKATADLKKKIKHMQQTLKLMADPLIKDYNSTQLEINRTWELLEKFHNSWRSDRERFSVRRLNTPDLVV